MCNVPSDANFISVTETVIALLESQGFILHSMHAVGAAGAGGVEQTAKLQDPASRHSLTRGEGHRMSQ